MLNETQDQIFRDYANRLMSKSQFEHMVGKLNEKNKFSHFERSVDILEDTGNLDGIYDLIETTALATDSL